MANIMSKVADFTMKVIMIFTTLVALIFFAGEYPLYSFIFGILTLLFLIALLTKGMTDIFSKE